MPVSIAIASDHRGIELKNWVKEILEKLDCEVKDFGASLKNLSTILSWHV